MGGGRAQEDLRGLAHAVPLSGYGLDVNKAIAGGSGGAAGVEVALPRPRDVQQPVLARFLDNERVLDKSAFGTVSEGP